MMQQPTQRLRHLQAFAAIGTWLVLGTGVASGVGGCSAPCSSLRLVAQRFYSVGGHSITEPEPMLEAVVEDASGQPAAGVIVEFFIETVDIGNASTGADGVARHSVQVPGVINGPPAHWSAQINQTSCVTANTAEYTNES